MSYQAGDLVWMRLWCGESHQHGRGHALLARVVSVVEPNAVWASAVDLEVQVLGEVPACFDDTLAARTTWTQLAGITPVDAVTQLGLLACEPSALPLPRVEPTHDSPS